MKTLSEYIYERSLLDDDLDANLDAGDDQLVKKKITKWVEDNKFFVHAGFTDKYITNDNKLELVSLKPYDGYDKEALKLPAPDYIHIKDVESISVHGNNGDNKFLNKLPKIDNTQLLYINAFSSAENYPNDPNAEFDLTNLPIDNIDMMFIETKSSKILSFPKKSNITTVKYSVVNLLEWEYDNIYTIVNANKFFKGLNTKYLIIPDAFFTKNYKCLVSFLPKWSEDRFISIDSEEGNILKRIFATKSFKELYVYSASYNNSNNNYNTARKVTPTKDGFLISKRNKHFKL